MLVTPKRRQTHYIPLIYLHISNKEKRTYPFNLFAVKRRWTEKYKPLCFWSQKTTEALYTIDLPPCISKKEIGDASFFLIRYETALDRKIYAIMLLRPKDNKGAINHCSTTMHFESNKEKGKKKRLIFPYSLWNSFGQKNIYHYVCKAKRRQTFYIPLIYLHAFRIRKTETENVSSFFICCETALDRKTYTSMLVRLKDSKRAIHHWSIFMNFE